MKTKKTTHTNNKKQHNTHGKTKHRKQKNQNFNNAPPGGAARVPDDWQLVPKKITLEMECPLSKADSYEIMKLVAIRALATAT